jgi:hypothetical protein
MSATPFLASSDGESFRLKLGRVYSMLTITGNTTDASSSAKSANPMVKIFLEEGSDSGDPDTVDSEASLGTLDDDADPAVIGLIVTCGDAAEFYECVVRKFSGDLTAATVTKKGSSSTGVTTTAKNLAVSVSLAGVDIDANTNVQKLGCEFFYRKV